MSKSKLSKSERLKRKQRLDRIRVSKIKEDHLSVHRSHVSHARGELLKDSKDRKPLPRVSVSFRIPAPIFNDLEYVALERGITRSEVLLLALDSYFKTPDITLGDLDL